MKTPKVMWTRKRTRKRPTREWQMAENFAGFIISVDAFRSPSRDPPSPIPLRLPDVVPNPMPSLTMPPSRSSFSAPSTICIYIF